jgi:hypothetical protein
MQATAMLLLLLLFSALPAVSHGWGVDGHLMTCNIAQARAIRQPVFLSIPDSRRAFPPAVNLNGHHRRTNVSGAPERRGSGGGEEPASVVRRQRPEQSLLLGRQRQVPVPLVVGAALHQHPRRRLRLQLRPYASLSPLQHDKKLTLSVVVTSSSPSPSGDCKDEEGVTGRCVAGAINNYTSQLLTYGKSGSPECMSSCPSLSIFRTV